MIPFTMPLSMYGQQSGYGTSGTNKILSEFGKSMFNALTGGNYNQQNPSGVSLLGGMPKQPSQPSPMTDLDKDRMMEELYPSQPRFDAVPPVEEAMPVTPQVIPPRIPMPNLTEQEKEFLRQNNPNLTYEEAEKFLNQYGMSLI